MLPLPAGREASPGRVTPAKQGKGNKTSTSDATHGPPPAERRAAMTWAQRLKRVFNIDIETCNTCGVRILVQADHRF